MKKIIIGYGLLLSVARVTAQGGFFNQQSTQHQYQQQQIAALQVYIGYLQQGYTIARGGLNLISNSKQADVVLHQQHFNSLVTVNPSIRQYPKLPAIIALMSGITTLTSNCIHRCTNSHQLSSVELAYLQQVFDQLLSGCSGNLDELLTITQNNTYSMTDDERIRAIDKIYADMQEKQAFAQSFSNTASKFCLQRTSEAAAIHSLTLLNQQP